MAEVVAGALIIGATIIAAPPVAVEPRTDCEIMRGTQYQRQVWQVERAFFLSTCVIKPEPEPPRAPVQTVQAVSRASERVTGGSWQDMVCSYSWPCDEAMQVIQAESGGNPLAVNPASGACGLMQTLPCVGYGDLRTHLNEAYRKWSACGGSFSCDWYAFW